MKANAPKRKVFNDAVDLLTGGEPAAAGKGVQMIERLIERIEIDHERNIHVTFRFKNEFQGKAVEPCATM